MGRRGRGELFGRAVRRHPCQRARRHPAVQDHLAKARSPSGVRRIEALTGEAARQWLTDREDRLKRSRRRAQGLARGGARARRRAGRGAPPARARARRGEEGAGAGRRQQGRSRRAPSRSAATASSARCSTASIPRACAAWSTRPSSASARAWSRWSRSMTAAPPSRSASPTISPRSRNAVDLVRKAVEARRRAGRRRPSRHGPGRRARRRQGGRGARRGPRRARAQRRRLARLERVPQPLAALRPAPASSSPSSMICWRSSARFSWIEAITGPIAMPRSTSTASDSCSEDSSVSGTASVAPAR